MKLKKILESMAEPLQPLEEKKEALTQAQALNITLHFDSEFQTIGSEGKPELIITVSTSSAGSKNLVRVISSAEESEKVIQAVKLDIRRLTRKYDAAMEHIFAKYSLHIK